MVQLRMVWQGWVKWIVSDVIVEKSPKEDVSDDRSQQRNTLPHNNHQKVTLNHKLCDYEEENLDKLN